MTTVYEIVLQILQRTFVHATPLLILFILGILAYGFVPKILRYFSSNVSSLTIRNVRVYILLWLLTLLVLIGLWYVNTYEEYIPQMYYPFTLLLLVITVVLGPKVGVITLFFLLPLITYYLVVPRYLIFPTVYRSIVVNGFISLLSGFGVGIIIRRYQLSLSAAMSELRELQWRTRRRLAEKSEEENALKAAHRASLTLETTQISLVNIQNIIVHEANSLVKGQSSGLGFINEENNFVIDIMQFGKKRGKQLDAAKAQITDIVNTILQKRSIRNAYDVSEKEIRTIIDASNTYGHLILLPIHGNQKDWILFVTKKSRYDSFSDKDKLKLRLFASHTALAIRNAQQNDTLTELMRARDQFASAISHELKTPLSTIKLYAQLIVEQLKSVKNTQDQQRGLETIDQEVDRLTLLINSLHDFAKIQSGRFEIDKKNFSLRRVCEERLEIAQLLHQEHTFVLKSSIPKAPITADKLRVEQVITNLLSNAAKYSPVETTITMTLQKNRESYVLSVNDQGKGIPAEESDHIFEPFYRIKDQKSGGKKGLGLGLYITKEIIELHKGKIWVESEVGSGSTFYIRLPVASK